ncbi:MBL fold metallo-hydrolase [Corynebacterium marinum]|jgi:glyoxylase-like metal-dependent hydrolase (beta-lactamase superfamily II)|nr:MBL fold metallo-hydrolase [Corynebacterium marinum]AJK68984.1 putative zinc (Zn2+)-dependent hydrolase [Corynebacterium marinum DSM 44953]GGO20124.1 Zn-dependent hydrolase [Corynebacterium marinum]
MQLHGFAAGPYNTNTYVLAHEGEAFVVDPGMHSHRQVEKALAETSASLVAVVLTHGHIDHTRDAGSLAAQYDVPVHIHPEDAFMLAGGDGISQRSQVLFDAAHMTPVRDLRDLHDGQDLTLAGVELKVRHAPGHSPGSCLLVHEQFAFTGDVIFQGSIGRTDFAGSDPAQMDATLRGPVWELDDSLQLFPGHGAGTSMRAERATNPFLLQLGM